MDGILSFYKIWEIEESYHCSIIGTCLTIQESLKIFKKSGITIPKTSEDYEIHGATVKCTAETNNVSRNLQNFLENKYRNYFSVFAKAMTSSEIENLWYYYSTRGDIPGPYLCVITSKATSVELINKVFGEVHMMSHLSGSSTSKALNELELAKKKIEDISESKKYYKNKVKELEAQIKIPSDEINKILFRLEIANKRIASLENGEEINNLRHEIIALTNILEAEKFKRDKVESAYKKISDSASELIKENEILVNKYKSAESEINSMEKTLDAILDKLTGSCESCDKDVNCECMKLRGKCILYVGGYKSVVNQCKSMVEFFGGKFLYHDGGIEENVSRLPDSLKRADYVFCPVNCISHNACHVVKKICTQYSKPLLILRSPGISGFLKGIDELSGSNIYSDSSGFEC